MDKLKNFFSKHGSYYGILWNISLFFAGIWAFYRWIVELFINAHNGNLIGFVLVFIFQSLIMGLTAVFGGLFLFVVLLIITLVPYLIIRGLVK